MKIQDLDKNEADVSRASRPRTCARRSAATRCCASLSPIRAARSRRRSLTTTRTSGSRGEFNVGDVVKIRGHRGNYRGKPQLQIRRVRVLDERDAGAYDPDEIFGKGHGRAAWRRIAPHGDRHRVRAARRARRDPGALARADHADRRRPRVADRQGPLAQPALLARRVDRRRRRRRGGGHVLFAPLDEHVDELGQDAPDWLVVRDEKRMLEMFWSLAGQAKLIVTFNGRNFDPALPAAPLGHPRRRSPRRPRLAAALPTRAAPRPLPDPRRRQLGARPMNLDAACWAFGIESPKDAMDGSKVAKPSPRAATAKSRSTTSPTSTPRGNSTAPSSRASSTT